MKFDFQKWASIIFKFNKCIYIYIHIYKYIYTNIYIYKHTYIYKFSSFFKTILYKFLHFLKCWSFNFSFLIFFLFLVFPFLLGPCGHLFFSRASELCTCCGAPLVLCAVALWRYRRRKSFLYINDNKRLYFILKNFLKFFHFSKRKFLKF